MDAFGRTNTNNNDRERQMLEEKLRNLNYSLTLEDRYYSEAKINNNQVGIDSHGRKIEKLKEEIKDIKRKINELKKDKSK